MTGTMLIFAVLTVISALGVILSRRPLNSALWLVLTLFLVAVHFLLLGAEFIAAMQILVYAGAIMVLVIFVIMLLGVQTKPERRCFGFFSISGALMTGAYVGVLIHVIERWSGPPVGKATTDVISGTTEEIGSVMFNAYLFPFELVSVLLLAAIIGAVVLAFEPVRPLPPGRGLRAKQEGQ